MSDQKETSPRCATVLEFKHREQPAAPCDPRSAVMNAAYELFSSRDHARVSLEDIAKAAGVTVADVHALVGDKAALRQAVFKELLSFANAFTP